MRSLNILGVGPELRLRAARRVAVCAGHTYEGTPDQSGLVDRISRCAPDVVIYDWGAGEDEVLARLDAISALENAPRVVLLADPASHSAFLVLLQRPWFTQILALRAPWFMGELGATLAKLAGGAVFGIDRCLPADAKIHEILVAGSDEKNAVLSRIEAFMDALGVRSRVLTQLTTIADELFTNAVYDAPAGPEGPRYRHWARTRRVDLSPGERPTIRFGSDGRIFGISATDPFGNLGSGASRAGVPIRSIRKKAGRVSAFSFSMSSPIVSA